MTVKNLMMVCEAKLVLEKQGESTGKIEATVTTVSYTHLTLPTKRIV